MYPLLALVWLCYFHPFSALGWHLLIGFSFSGLVVACACRPMIERYLTAPGARQEQGARTSDIVNQADEKERP